MGASEYTEWCRGLILPVPRQRNALQPEVVKKLLELDRDDGMTRREIAQRLCVHHNTVTKYLRIAGRPLHVVGIRAQRLAERTRLTRVAIVTALVRRARAS